LPDTVTAIDGTKEHYVPKVVTGVLNTTNTSFRPNRGGFWVQPASMKAAARMARLMIPGMA